MIELDNVTKIFKQKNKFIYACDNIDIEIGEKQVFGIIGPNGAGKTTSLRLISTLMNPSSGKILVNGFNTVKDKMKIREIIGFLTSEMRLPDNYTPRELMKFFGKLNNMKNSDLSDRIEFLTNLLSLEEYVDVLIGKLSTGNKQKTLIAISIIHNPSIIIFDEPTAGLDLSAAQSVLRIINIMKDDGKTIILSTHNMTIAERMCDRLAFINEGKIIKEGHIEDIKELYGSKDLEEIYFNLI
ncbi:ABC transporter ATP-binding protein [candidate division WOR-3 bacterium]|jgi:sodium transport system ATP-binding protein|nr:ABC transporter ATP-binding protein [candidate division WOR-3 bacterium]